MSELPSRYSPQETEDKWYAYWEDNKFFHAEPNTKKKPYSVVIPPPNVTGILHMGHALNNTLQDIIIRYKRMRGFEALWMPGTDHAGIATQNVVEKQLAQEGKKRQDIGREEFVKKLWKWKQEYGDTIIRQLKKLGASCDWDRTRFTMDDHYSGVVQEVFIRLHKKGLVYQGQYIINWCPRCHTALSDEEAEHQEVQGAFYHIHYPFKDEPKKYLTVATTRPETMLGDTAVAVNPKDKRYKNLIGKKLMLPLVNREIEIIADSFVDPKFGTGAVKVTPAHDPNDFEMGQRHNLTFINIMHPDARLNKNAGEFSGMNRLEGREAVVDTLKESGLLEKIEAHTHSVGHCYRCHTMVEPYLSKQWFVKMEPLAKPAIAAVKNGTIKFHPARWNKVYLNWMENIRDWCISRQIWWGHRIPAWYCIGDDHCKIQCREPIISRGKPEKCPHCGSTNLRQDEDVLDTWFSSWLWPFATFGWPQDKTQTDYFYPTASLFTAPEIIFFWVARMVMAGIEFMDDIPFSDVYLHGTVRDAQGKKMSKSLGNAIDPLKIIDEYGADALRFSLILNSGQDLFVSKEKFEIGRNFANKIWNATRLILLSTKDKKADSKKFAKLNLKTLDLPSRWIISQFYHTLEKTEKAIDTYRFSEAEGLIYDFFWKNFCDWYLEMIKDKLSDETTQTVALNILEQTLRMMHPFLPFVTEEIWQKIKKEGDSIIIQPWPEVNKKMIDKKADHDVHLLTEAITAIRNLRAQWNIGAKDTVDCIFASPGKADQALVENNIPTIEKLTNTKVTIAPQTSSVKNAATGIVQKIKFYIPLSGIIDIEKEKKRITTQIDEQKKASQSIASRLKNKNFIKKAPKQVIEKDKLRLESLDSRIKELKKVIQNLN